MNAPGKQILEQLEKHWQSRYSAREVHGRIRQALVEIRRALQHNSENARIASHALLRLAAREEIPPQELEAANRAFRELAKTLGIAVIGILPGAFLTLPVLHVLSRHLDIELLSGSRRQSSRGNGTAH